MDISAVILSAKRTFAAYFGIAPDSDMRRITREDAGHTNKVHL
jgi:hypothetical protein